MAHLDLTNRRLELQIVYMGPQRSGTSTTLRVLHAACPVQTRGELASVEHGAGRAVVCDYLPIDLPRWGDLAVRAHVYATVVGEGGQTAQRRILANADAVVFVADLRRASLAGDVAAWQALNGLLGAPEEGDTPCPLIVAANHCDALDAVPAEELRAALAAETPSRPVADPQPTCAVTGGNIVACFRRAVVSATAHAVPPESPERAAAGRKAFLEAFDQRFRAGPAFQNVAGAETRQMALPSAQGISEGTGFNMALDVSRWLALRDLDVKRLQRERALGRLLLEVGQTCLAATDAESLLRRVLGALTMNLEAVTGWIGLPDGETGHKVYDPLGVSTDGCAFVETAEALGMGLADGGVVAVGPETGSSLPGGAAGGRGLFAPFPAGDGRRGWLLLVGPPDRGLPEDADAVLATAGAFVGITLARLAALKRLRESHAALEERVGARTQEIRQENRALEERVKERTRELEDAKKAIVDAERQLLDRERAEGVHRLAAGLAHELNNPIGAALANVDFVLEGLQRIEPTVSVLARGEIDDVRTAAEDARRELKRVADSVTALFGDATQTRRAALRTPVAHAAREALRDYTKAVPGLKAPTLDVGDPVACGVPPAECSRWMFRLLTTLAQAQAPAEALKVDRTPEGPRVRMRLAADPDAATDALVTLSQEMTRAGARLVVGRGSDSRLLDLVLPPALGESTVCRPLTTERVR